MRFKCPFCSYIIKSDDTYRGYKVKCPSCEKAVLVPVSPFERDCVIADFVIDAKIGRGSIGTVYKATQISLDRVVALKVLSPDYTTAKGISDFLKEARAAAKLSHTNIVQALAVGEEDGTCYMAMNYITGITLKDKIETEGKISVDEALHIIQQIAEALYYAWDEAKIIHRDVKPDNIMITEEGIVKLTDLGLAMRQTDWKEDMEISGSPSYMSPEQFSGEKLDTRSDIYSLGITLYQMLSGKLPFEGDTLRTVAKQHFEQDAVSLHRMNPKIPSKVSSMVKKMIAKLPEDRYSSMEDLLNKIWTIRQKTAPNKDLVPDVHTISINRLDYDYQSTPSRDKDDSYIRDLETRFRANEKYKVFTWIFLFLTAFLAVGLAFALKSGRKTDVRISRKIENLLFQAESGSTDYNQLSAAAKEILLSIGTPENINEEALVFKLKYAAQLLENSELIATAEDLDAKIDEKNKKIEGLKKIINEIKNWKSSEETEVWKNMRELHKKLEETQNRNNQLTRQNFVLKNKIRNIYKEEAGEWKKFINLKLYSLVSKASIKKAIFFIKTEAMKKPENKKWFSERIDWLDKLLQIYTVMTESGSRFSGMEIPEEGKIVMIDKGDVHYQNLDSGIIRTMKWSEIPTETAFRMTRDLISPETKDNDLKAFICILKGNIGNTLKYKLEDKCIKDLCDSVINQNLSKIDYMAELDKEKARTKLKALLKQLEETEKYDAIKEKYKDLLTEEENSWNEEFHF